MRLKQNSYTKEQGKVAVKGTLPSQSILDKRPKFSLKYLDGRYCVTNCDRDEKAAFIDTLHHLSKMTWGEIFKNARHASGFEKIPFRQLNGISEKFSQKKIITFRFMGMKPMLGFSDKEVFYVLALDRDHTCYQH